MPADNKKISEQIEAALLKKATGYSAEEITEEYQVTDGESVLIKKKVTMKNVPPDISAAKLLLEAFTKAEKDIGEMTDEELEQEKNKLIRLLIQKDIKDEDKKD